MTTETTPTSQVRGESFADLLDASIDVAEAADSAVSQEFLSVFGDIGLEIVGGRVAEAVSSLTSMDLGGVFAKGWDRFDSLRESGRATAGDRTRTDHITLTEHNINWSRVARIEVHWSELVMHTLHVELSARAHLVKVSAVVTGGRLMAVRADDVEIEAAVHIDGRRCAQGATRLDPELVMQFGDGILLTDPVDPGAMPVRT